MSKGFKIGNTSGFKKGNKPHNFKDVGVGYNSLHQWVAYHKPKSAFCEKCGQITDKLDASSTNHTYERDISKWQWLCRKCHREDDKKFRKVALVCVRGHLIEGNNLYINNRGGRVCKACKKIRAHTSYLRHREKAIYRVKLYRKNKKRSTL